MSCQEAIAYQPAIVNLGDYKICNHVADNDSF